MSSPVELASTCHLPERLAHPADKAALKGKGDHLNETLSVCALAPYQAMPVHGPVLANPVASILKGGESKRGLPILDPISGSSFEVGRRQRRRRRREGAGLAGPGENAWQVGAAPPVPGAPRRRPACRPERRVPVPPQEREAAIDDILQKYFKKLEDRTQHHMG
jgi:hypothetical protein